jgi:hypothetical protein
MRKKSKYKPKPINPDAHNWVLSGLKKLPEVGNVLTTLKIKTYAALDEIKAGRATTDHVDVIIAAMNMAEAYAMTGKGEDWRDEIRAAQDALFTMAKRGLVKGRFLFTGQEMNAIALAVEIHGQQLDQSTVQELEKCVKIVSDEIKNKRARVIA